MPKPIRSSDTTKKGNKAGNNMSHHMAIPRKAEVIPSCGNNNIKMEMDKAVRDMARVLPDMERIRSSTFRSGLLRYMFKVGQTYPY
jgi:hypothetical protein